MFLQQLSPMVSGLIETVDKVMIHMASNMESSLEGTIAIDGKSSVAGQLTFFHLQKCPESKISLINIRTLNVWWCNTYFFHLVIIICYRFALQLSYRFAVLGEEKQLCCIFNV